MTSQDNSVVHILQSSIELAYTHASQHTLTQNIEILFIWTAAIYITAYTRRNRHEQQYMYLCTWAICRNVEGMCMNA